MSNSLDNNKGRYTRYMYTLKYYILMHLSLDEMISRNNITFDLSDKCRSIMNTLESGNIYLDKYKENIFKC